MEKSNKIFEWLEDHNISFEALESDLLKIGGKIFYLIDDEDGCLDGLAIKSNLVPNFDCDYIAYTFGPDVYFEHIRNVGKVSLTKLVNFGTKEYPFRSTHLGAHGVYEQMSGTGSYKEIIQTAKFLGYDTVGICEKNTLAGTLPFQFECKKQEVKPVIGYETEIGGIPMKLYCKDAEGWSNLLKINKIINVDHKKVEFRDMGGLVCVVSNLHTLTGRSLEIVKQAFDEVYYQVNTNEYFDPKIDILSLDNLKLYLYEFCDDIEPILISDSYCLYKDHCEIKAKLNQQGHVHSSQTVNHYIRPIRALVIELLETFKKGDGRGKDLVRRSIDNIRRVTDLCEFEIETNGFKLPEYEMTEEESGKFGTKKALFNSLIKAGMGKHKWNCSKEVLMDRVKEEYELIDRGGFIDYFLILWDIITWSEAKGIQVGPGRGSAAGSLLSYLLGITKIDPLEHGLLFSRFLNEGRIGLELPDIDVDFSSHRRDEVIQYMRDRYGADYVCRVGTYSKLQVKGSVKEMTRVYGVKSKYPIDYLTGLIDDTGDWSSVFESAVDHKNLKAVIKNNSKLFHQSSIAYGSIKSTSIHACAVIIVPKNMGTVFEQIPVKKMEDGTLISEWEGGELGDIGYLKEDILSTKQMGKFEKILNLIEKNQGERVDLLQIPIEDQNVLQLFRNGWTRDVFQFGSEGLTSYISSMAPDCFNDLVAANALYRPGAMASQAHKEYIGLKRGELDVEYDHPLMESVLRETYGLMIYQEQAIQTVMTLAGFTPVEADGVRKATGKKILEKMQAYRDQFVKQCSAENQIHEDISNAVWEKIEAFAGYGFNKSHAAAYALTSYHCNYFKNYYPLEFWTVALQGASSDDINSYVDEAAKGGEVNISTPDINSSTDLFYSDKEKNTIFWSFTQIKFVGSVASESIVEERDKEGRFFSLEEFLERVEKKIVNIRTVRNLILCGAFDNVHMIEEKSARFSLIEQLYDIRGGDVPEIYKANRGVEFFWAMEQNDLCKINDINYESLVDHSDLNQYANQYLSTEDFLETSVSDDGEEVVVSGIAKEVTIRKTKRGDDYALIKLEGSNGVYNVKIWGDTLSVIRDDVDQAENRLTVLRGKLAYNTYFSNPEVNITRKLGKNIIHVLTIQE